MNEKYLLFNRLIFARDSNHITIFQVFCNSLKKELDVTYLMARGKVVLIRLFFFFFFFNFFFYREKTGNEWDCENGVSGYKIQYQG